VSRLGIEATPATLRAVAMRRLGRGVSRCVEVPWDPESPAEGIAALGAQCGPVDSLALAVGLGFTSVVRAELPPAPHEARERMLALEPERFFATAEPLETALVPGSDVAFGVSRAQLARWVAAFESLAPVTRVDPSAVAFARALRPVAGRNGTRSDVLASQATRTYALDAGEGERGLITMRGSRVVSVRRVAGDAEPDAEYSAVPRIPDIAPTFLAALGAVLGDDASQQGTLWPVERRRAAQHTAARQMATALLAAVAGLVLAGAAFDRWRERTLVALEAEAERLTLEAAPALAAQQRLMLLAREDDIVRQVVGQRSNPAAGLAAIGLALPNDAVVTVARGTGSRWQIDGTARNVAPLVPRLDRSGAFENVRSLAASSRFLDGTRSRETFSIAFDVRSRP
jgi:Tfp pilus assembly protein PilN